MFKKQRMSMETEVVAKRIHECRIQTQKGLKLNNLNLTEIPDIASLWWVEELDLSSNRITKVDRKMLPDNLKLVLLNHNKISNITADDLPLHVDMLNLQGNEIKCFDGSKFQNLIKLNISENVLTTFYFPPKLVKLDISNNRLEEIDEFPDTLLKFNCEDNMLEDLENINNNLLYINISNNRFKELPNLPESVETIIAKDNNIENFWYLPENAVTIDLANNRISDFYGFTFEFPSSLKTLNLNDNLLTEFTLELPEGLETLLLKSNRLETLPDIPKSVKVLDISDNCLNKILPELKSRNISINYENNLMEDSDNEILDGDGYDLNFLFGNNKRQTSSKKKSSGDNILNYFKNAKEEPTSKTNTIYLGSSPNYNHDYFSYPFIKKSPPKKKYVNIYHKRRVIV